MLERSKIISAVITALGLTITTVGVASNDLKQGAVNNTRVMIVNKAAQPKEVPQVVYEKIQKHCPASQKGQNPIVFFAGDKVKCLYSNETIPEITKYDVCEKFGCG